MNWRVTGVRWLKFNAVGGIGIGVQLIVLAVLKGGLGFDYLLATGLAVETAVFHNFLWHERFTWADRVSESSWGRFVKFNLTTGLFSIVGNLLIMKALASWIEMNYLIANGIAIAVCSMVNFVVSDRVVFTQSG
jgi:putative flippase GtrA